MDEERERRRVLGRLRGYLTRKRSPRAVLSGIMMLTALAGFAMSVGLLKLGLAPMWARYPLAVLGAWGIFLLLVRSWAERERESIRVDEELAGMGAQDEVFDGAPGRSVIDDGPVRRGWNSWLDWLNPFELLVDDAAGFLAGLAILAAIIALFGMLFAVAGLIVQAEVLLAEVLLDAVLVSALYHRVQAKEPRWWLEGALRLTVGPVVATLIFLMATGYLMQRYAPEARSIGAVWSHWRGAR